MAPSLLNFPALTYTVKMYLPLVSIKRLFVSFFIFPSGWIEVEAVANWSKSVILLIVVTFDSN